MKEGGEGRRKAFRLMAFGRIKIPILNTALATAAAAAAALALVTRAVASWASWSSEFPRRRRAASHLHSPLELSPSPPTPSELIELIQ